MASLIVEKNSGGVRTRTVKTPSDRKPASARSRRSKLRTTSAPLLSRTSESATCEAERAAFEQRRAQDGGGVRAERARNGHFVLALRRAREQQRGQIHH